MNFKIVVYLAGFVLSYAYGMYNIHVFRFLFAL